MYLSYILIDTGEDPDRPRPGRLWLRNLYHVHQRLCMGFPSVERKTDDPYFIERYDLRDFELTGNVHEERSKDKGFLFRIDPLPAGRTVIIVQSASKPDWNYAFQNAGFLVCPALVKAYDPQYQDEEHLLFRLVANPTRKLTENSLGSDGRPISPKWIGKRIPVEKGKAEEWLIRQGEKAGFEVEKDRLKVQTGYAGALKPVKPSPERFFLTRYEGVLKVIDPTKFRETIIHGIGPAKGFGFGLLSVAVARE